VIQLGLMRPQTHFDIAQALAPSELGEDHAQVVIQTRETFGIAVAVVLRHQTAKGMQRQMLHELRKDVTALMHDGVS
jgi:hypothetical protein